MECVAPQVLVIDDSPTMVRGLSLQLRSAGFDAVGCDGVHVPVVEVLRRSYPQVAVLDWHLEGGTAEDLLGTLRTSHPNMPVIVHSGDGRAEVELRARTAGAWGHVLKGSGQLLHQVELAVEEHARRVVRDSYPTMDQIQTTALRGALTWSGGNVSAAARNLGMTRGRMERMMKNLGLAA